MEYLFHILILFSVFGTLALAQNLVMGEAGMLSASSAAFYGVGAYVVGILTTKLGLSFFTVLLIAPAIGCLVAFLIGTTFVRFRGDYFMLSSLGFLMIFNTVARNWEALTGGSYGISGISKPNVFGLTLGTPFSFLFLADSFCLMLQKHSSFLLVP
jgi:ABC-type branched-subunit amino acid transport system permease subunit